MDSPNPAIWASPDPLAVAKDRLEQLLPLLSFFNLPASPLIDQNGPPGGEISSTDLPGGKKYESAVKKEIEWLEKILSATPPSTPTKAPPASNAPHLLALFDSAYHAPYPVIGLNQAYPRTKGKPTTSREKGKANQSSKVPDVKVHVVAEGGKTWIRVIAITNIRLLFEFHESDSYLNSDSSFSDASSSSHNSLNALPTFNPSHLRTSLHKTAHQLLQAASLYSPPPKVQIQCPRLKPLEDEDGRVQRTVDELRSLGIDVLLSSSAAATSDASDALFHSFSNPPPQPTLGPTRNLNLDLSVLIALASSIVHDPLPATGIAEGVYKPLIRKYNKDGTPKPGPEATMAKMGGTDNWRALTIQLESEIAAPLVEEIVQTLERHRQGEEVIFWTTHEARERLRMIVSKLGGELEKKRSEGMFSVVGEVPEKEEARAKHFWNDSRYQTSVGPFHLALSSIRLSAPSGSPYPSSYPSTPPSHLNSSSSTDSYQTLNSALATLDLSRTAFSSSSSPPPKLIEPFSLLHPHVVVYLDPSHPSHSRPPASLTPHTLRTLLFGVERGMTTLSANRASLKSMWKVMEGRDPSLGVWGGEKLEAVGWVMDPRSLGEQMTME